MSRTTWWGFSSKDPRSIILKALCLSFPGGSVVRIHLAKQGPSIRSIVLDDPTGSRATKLVSHNYLACALESESCNYWAHEPQLLKPTCPRARAPGEATAISQSATTREQPQHKKVCTRLPQPSTAKMIKCFPSKIMCLYSNQLNPTLMGQQNVHKMFP